jgi:hypothetical protein
MSRIDVSPLLAQFVEARSKRADFYYGEKGPASTSGVGFRTIYGRPETAGEYAQSIAGNLIPNTLLPGSAPQYSLGDAALGGMLASGATREILNRWNAARAAGVNPLNQVELHRQLMSMTGKPNPSTADLHSVARDLRGFFPAAGNTSDALLRGQTNSPNFTPTTTGDPSINVQGGKPPVDMAQGHNPVANKDFLPKLRETLAGGSTAQTTSKGEVPGTNFWGKQTGNKVQVTEKSPRINPNLPVVSGQTLRSAVTSPLAGAQNAYGRMSRFGPAAAFAAPFLLKALDDSMSNRGPGASEMSNGSFTSSGRNVGPAGVVEGIGRSVAPDVSKGKAPYTNKK